jgi:predicted transcriptional regulator
MTLHLTPAQEQRLQQLAAESHRTPDELAQEAVDSYLNHLETLAAEVQEGEASAERDGWLTHEEVFERLHKRIQKAA